MEVFTPIDPRNFAIRPAAGRVEDDPEARRRPAARDEAARKFGEDLRARLAGENEEEDDLLASNANRETEPGFVVDATDEVEFSPPTEAGVGREGEVPLVTRIGRFVPALLAQTGLAAEGVKPPLPDESPDTEASGEAEEAETFQEEALAAAARKEAASEAAEEEEIRKLEEEERIFRERIRQETFAQLQEKLVGLLRADIATEFIGKRANVRA